MNPHTRNSCVFADTLKPDSVLQLGMKGRRPFDDITDLFEQLGEEIDEVGEALETRARSDVAVDILERDDAFVVHADLPGFDREDIDLSVSGRELTIRAESTADEEAADETDEGRFHRRERRERSITRRVRLPGEVVAADATAKYNHGVLTVTLPKPASNSEDTTRIDVE